MMLLQENKQSASDWQGTPVKESINLQKLRIALKG